MDKSSNSGESLSKDVNNTQAQQKSQNSSRNFRSRQQGERDLPFKDLRELLDYKRQNPDGKNGGPPLDPKYNYLSDPMRDGESSTSTNSKNFNNNNFGTSRFSNRTNFRNPRGRGRSNFPVEKFQHPKPGYSNEPTRFPRDWDQGKEDPRNRRSNSFKTSQYQGGPSNDPTNFRYQDPRPINPNYKGPPHKYIPNYRGSSQRRFPPRRYPNPDPINISVEYNVEDGFRKCTVLDVKLDKVWKKGHQKELVQASEGEVEENWDVDPKNDSAKEGENVDAEKRPNVQEGSKNIGGAKRKPDFKKFSRGRGFGRRGSHNTGIGEAKGNILKDDENKVETAEKSEKTEKSGNPEDALITRETESKVPEKNSTTTSEIGGAIENTSKNEPTKAENIENIEKTEKSENCEVPGVETRPSEIVGTKPQAKSDEATTLGVDETSPGKNTINPENVEHVENAEIKPSKEDPSEIKDDTPESRTAEGFDKNAV